MDRAAGVHIAIVGLAFVLIMLAMYLLPARAGRLGSRKLRAVSWLLGAGAAASLAAASFGVPVGIAQRLAAACVLGWLVVLSWALVRSQTPQPEMS